MSGPRHNPPPWLTGRSLYQVHALRASGAPDANPDVHAGAPCGDGLRRLIPWLEHVAGLGCGGLLLTPVAVSATHGYDTVDPLRLDQRLGDEAAFDDLVEACRRHGLRLVLDGVFNHVGRAFPPFADVLANGAASPYADWFRLDFSAGGPDGFSYRDFEGHRELVALNHRSPAVLDWAVEVACHWLDRGADGWRLDVAYAVPRPFWHDFAARVLARHPDAWLFGEMIHGDYAGFVDEGGLHSVTQYELHKAVWSSLNDRNLFELAWALDRHRGFAEVFRPVTFVGNHDVTRIASNLKDPDHLGPAVGLLFTLPGTPCVYYGDELGATGTKGEGAGADSALRPALDELPDPASLADPASPAGGGPGAAATLDLYRSLVDFRRRRPWLDDGALTVSDLANEHIRIQVEADGGGPAALLVVHLADGPSAPVDAGAGWHFVLGRPPGEDGTVTGPGWALFERQ
ncbi:MAG TPA: alpha-amylase family glycosyl hydrolase [Acidimicrobiales bacterium]|nr:alpha-amylase family glycosyl hydrolase [Acidimicrobiales bacterium]